jgi:hypothetical protein
MTQPSSEPYYKERRPPPNSCSGKRTSTSPPMNVPRTSSEERSQLHLRHGITRTSKPTSAGRRGLAKKFMLLDHPSLVPEGHPIVANEHWTTSSMPSARTTRTCVILFGTAEISSTSSGMADPSNLYHLPHHEEDPENLDNLRSRKGEEAELSCVSTEKSTSSSTDTGRKKQEAAEAQGLSDTGGSHECSRPVSMVRTPDHLHSSRSMAQLRSSGQVPAPRRSGDPREQGRNGFSGRGKQHQRHLPPDTLRLGSHTQRAP